MRDFYEKYYAAVEHGRVHAAFCERAYWRDMEQHGFVTVEQLKFLIDVTHLNVSNRALDLGCGDGEIAEFLSDATEVHITGLDYIESAIARAKERTTTKRDRLDFRVGDLTCPTLPLRSFDMILSLDTIYFSPDYARTLESWKDLSTSDGQMVIFYSHGANPENTKETFRRETLPPD